MEHFKELTTDEQLDLIKHVLEGNDLIYYQNGQAKGTLFGDTDNFHICKNAAYTKQPTKLETLYKEQEAIQEKIDAELKRLGKPVTNDNVEVVQSPSEDEKTSENDSLERITHENWKSLGIKVGDRVKVGRVGDRFFSDKVGHKIPVTDIEDEEYEDKLFLELAYYYLEYHSGDELYLIRTEEGSLND